MSRPPKAPPLALPEDKLELSVLSEFEPGFIRQPGQLRSVKVRRSLKPAVNRGKYRWLNGAARRHLARAGFAVVRPRDPVDQFHSLYIDNQYRGLPSFVTTDAALHLTHQLFDHALKQAEQDILAPALGRLVDDLRSRCRALPSDLGSAGQIAQERISLRLEIAYGLLSAGPVSAAAAAQIERIESLGAKGPPDQNPFGLDFSDFVVRGHYTTDELLTRYFRAHLFLSLARVNSAQEAALLVGLVVGHPDSRHLLAVLSSFVRVMVGPLGGRTPLDMEAAAFESFGSTPDWARLVTEPGWVKNLERVPVTLLPRGWPRDNDLLVQGVDVDKRPWPDPLDLMVALGSARARELLAPELKAWPGLGGRLDKAAAAVRSGRALDTRSVGGRWLASLRWLLMDYPKGYASFQQTESWLTHSLVTALGAWTELRRDTILYTRPPVVWAEGGDEDSLPPSRAGFVEPVPELYGELAQVLSGFADALDGLGRVGHAGQDYRRKPAPVSMLQAGVSLLKFLQRCAQQQLSGKGLSRAEHEQLAEIGTRFEHILSGGGTVRAEPVPVVADVYYFGDPETGIKQPLLVATGPVDEVIVAVPLGRRTVLARGAVLSFYSFVGQRPMSDDDWRGLLRSGKAPAQAKWARPIKLKTRRRPPKKHRARH